MSEAPSFFVELKRRNVFRAAAFYAASAWLLVQVATQVFPFFHIPEWVVRWIVVATALGFIPAMLLSWFYEWTPRGIQLESRVPPDESITDRTGRKLDRWIIAILAFAVVLLLANTFILHREAVDGPITAAAFALEKSIAVLPLVNTGGDPNNEYFSDGLSEELIAVLAKVPALKVIGRSSSFLFKGSSDDSRIIGQKLGVLNLLEGSVRRQGDRVRIVAALISAADGRELWTETYDRELKDVFAVQSEIAAAVTGQLKIKLLGPPLQSDAAPSNESLTAYTALQQGNFYLSRVNQEGFRKAVEFYNEAIRLDPTYALAYANLSIAWQFLGQTGEDGTEAFGNARNAAQTALSLPPNISQAHTAMGGILLYADQNYDAAAIHYRQAEELAPTAVLPKVRMTYLLFTQGRLEQAEEAARKSLALDPLDWGPYINLGRILIARERYDEAESVLRKGIELRPKGARWHMHITHIYLLKGNPAAALEEARLEPAGFFQDYALALAQQAQGDRAAADTALEKFIEKNGEAGRFQIASIYAFRKQPGEMFTWLERAYDQHDIPALTQLLTAPFIHNYGGDPRFAALCQKLKLPVPKTSPMK
jgi:serine/threonine-protein kinase